MQMSDEPVILAVLWAAHVRAVCDHAKCPYCADEMDEPPVRGSDVDPENADRAGVVLVAIHRDHRS